MEDSIVFLVYFIVFSIVGFFIAQVLLLLWLFIEPKVKEMYWKIRDLDLRYRFLLLVDKIRVWCTRK